MIASVSYGEELQKYEFTVTVKYHLTLQEIADKEKQIRKAFSDAKDIEIKPIVQCPRCPEDNCFYNYNGNTLLYTPYNQSH